MIYFVILICISRILFVSAGDGVMYEISLLNEEPKEDMQCSPWRKRNHSYSEPTTKHSATSNHIEDPLEKYKALVNEFLFGQESKVETSTEEEEKQAHGHCNRNHLDHYPSGNIMRSELFFNQKGVHLPIPNFMHRGHCRLRITSDHMQTAINAFAILVAGNTNDVLMLPPEYVLRSARTIAMIKLPREKLAAIWTVVKNGRDPQEIPYATLEMYRPLFKYINGREIARLNLSDNRILSYIGTHADLNRHQVGVVASRYIKLNPHWMESRYLNLMNNLLCGVPMTYMRKVPPNTYLQLTHQVFYHIRACDPLQRRFYLTIMTKTQALGKSFSWSARDVSHLGLLLAEVEGSDLSAINPAAMSGITAQVMLHIPAHNLQYFTEQQLRHIGQKPLTILAKKLKQYQHELRVNNGHGINNLGFDLVIVFLGQIIIR